MLGGEKSLGRHIIYVLGLYGLSLMGFGCDGAAVVEAPVAPVLVVEGRGAPQSLESVAFEPLSLLEAPVVEWPGVAQRELTRGFLEANKERIPFLNGDGGLFSEELVRVEGFRSVAIFRPSFDEGVYSSFTGHSIWDYAESTGVVLVETQAGKLFGAPTYFWEDGGGTSASCSSYTEINNTSLQIEGEESLLVVDVEVTSGCDYRPDYEERAEVEFQCEEMLRLQLGRPISRQELESCANELDPDFFSASSGEYTSAVLRQRYSSKDGFLGTELIREPSDVWYSGLFDPKDSQWKSEWPPALEGEVKRDIRAVDTWLDGGQAYLCESFALEDCRGLAHESLDGVEAMAVQSNKGGQLWLFDGERVLTTPLPLAQEVKSQGVGPSRLDLQCSPHYAIKMSMLDPHKAIVEWEVKRRCWCPSDLELACIKAIKTQPTAQYLDTYDCEKGLREEAEEPVLWRMAWLVDLEAGELLARLPLSQMAIDAADAQAHGSRLVRDGFSVEAGWGEAAVLLKDPIAQLSLSYGAEAIFELPSSIQLAHPLTMLPNPLVEGVEQSSR